MTQILHPDDDFASGTPTFGSLVCLYLGCAVTTSTTVPWNPSGVGFRARAMHGAYQTVDSYGIHDFNSAFHNGGFTAERAPSGTMYRRPFSADVTVTGTFEMRALAGGAPSVADFAPRGVMARVSGGTLVGDATADVRYRDVDCYMAALYQKTGDSTLRLGIYRWNAGVFALIGSESISLATASTIWTALATVTLTVSGTGGTVTLQAKVKGLGGAGTLTLNATDSSGSRIVTAGRCGFFSGADRVLSGKTTVDLCHLLAVDEGSTRTLQDEFLRLSLAAAKQTTADSAGTSGSGYLSSAYYWDAGTFDGSFVVTGKTYTGSKRLRRNATAGRADFDHQVTDDDVNAGRLILSQRPADNRFSQHRSVNVIIPSAPVGASWPTATGEVWAGIALRAAQAQPLDESPNTPAGAGATFPGNGTAGTAGTFYAFILRAQTSTRVSWILYRYVNGIGNGIGLLVETPLSVFPGYGVAFTMEMDVYPRNAADPFGPVVIACRVNGSPLAMPINGTPAGVTNPSAGVFHDSGSARIKQNLGEGLLTANGYLRTGTAAADIDPVFSAWTQLALTNATVLDQDQPSIAVDGTEGTPTGEDLSTILTPDWPFEATLETWEISNPFDSGHRQTIPHFTKVVDGTVYKRTGWVFRSSTVEQTAMDAILDFWDAHDGVEAAFNFTPPGEAQVPCAFRSDSFRHSAVARGPLKTVYRVEFEILSLL